jgi:two-component system CheB/CheR fusion protein
VDPLLARVATLPADLPAPIVLAQHLDPRRQSRLGEILSSRSTLPARTVTAQEPLLPGVVYVVASDLDVEITDHAVSVKTDSSPLPKPSIDGA